MKCLLQLPSICSWVHNLDYFISASNKLNEISIWAESNLPGSGPICHHISLGVCCITAVFLCNQMRPQHLPWGRRGRRQRLQRRGLLKEVCRAEGKHTDPSRHKEIFQRLLNFGFYGICRPELEGCICSRASLFNIHNYLLNRPQWFSHWKVVSQQEARVREALSNKAKQNNRTSKLTHWCHNNY